MPKKSNKIPKDKRREITALCVSICEIVNESWHTELQKVEAIFKKGRNKTGDYPTGELILHQRSVYDITFGVNRTEVLYATISVLFTQAAPEVHKFIGMVRNASLWILLKDVVEGAITRESIERHEQMLDRAKLIYNLDDELTHYLDSRYNDITKIQQDKYLTDNFRTMILHYTAIAVNQRQGLGLNLAYTEEDTKLLIREAGNSAELPREHMDAFRQYGARKNAAQFIGRKIAERLHEENGTQFLPELVVLSPERALEFMKYAGTPTEKLSHERIVDIMKGPRPYDL